MSEVLLWKDFKDNGDCDDCPIRKARICPDDLVGYGDEPREPPCESFNDDVDLNLWASTYWENQRLFEEWEDAEVKKERKAKERAQKAAATRREMRDYCIDEIYELKCAEQALKSWGKHENFVNALAEAFNFANSMFNYRERVAAKPEISENVKRLRADVQKAKEKLEEKRKQFYNERKNGGKQLTKRKEDNE